MFIAALFITTSNWEKYICSLAIEWAIKSQYNHIMEYYSEIERTKLLVDTQQNR